uniref:Uncharacterized protein n=1 Tax=Vitis vinifera TaxID=29760 RepID=F6HBR6_VITVI
MGSLFEYFLFLCIFFSKFS